MSPDFAELYAHLGIQPDCSLEEFRSACFRRISELHPDKQGTEASAASAPIQLEELIALYGTATRFHRRHGRLPGASPLRHAITPAALRNVRPTDNQADASTPPWGGSFRRHWALIALSIAVPVAVIWWNASAPDAVRFSKTGDHSQRNAQAPEPLIADQLELGMTEADVFTIQGQPLQIRDNTWDYGTSWLRFEKGRLVDWYSSPLHRLKTSTASPNRETITSE